MVLGVCRRVLGNAADAEDAFQATFLVLVRKAAAVVPRSQVGNWLYGVAVNTARKAKAMTRNRVIKERQAAERPRPRETPDDWEQIQAQLDEQLSRLPDKYRVPIVLCDLEGKPLKEAAQQLGCPLGTVASRLSRGRSLLARRLKNSGVLLTSGALAASLTECAASASVPGSLVHSTVKAATLFAAGPTAAGTISATVVALTEGVLRAMLMTRLKIIAALSLIVVAGALIAGAGSIPGWLQPLEGTAEAQTATMPQSAYKPPSQGSVPPSDNAPFDIKNTERDMVEQLRRELHRDPKSVSESVAMPVGTWHIEFSNGVKEVCQIDKEGAASLVEPKRETDGKAAVKGSVILVVFRDDRVERWTPVGQKMVVERWPAIADYQAGKPILGIAERTTTTSNNHAGTSSSTAPNPYGATDSIPPAK